MITKDSIETTKGFKRTSPRLLSYWKICFNDSWRQLCQQCIIYQRDDEFSNSTLERKKKNPAVAELFAEREVSLAEGEAPYIFPSNTLRTSTLLFHLYVVRFLTCNSFVIHFAKVAISLETMPVTTQHPIVHE